MSPRHPLAVALAALLLRWPLGAMAQDAEPQPPALPEDSASAPSSGDEDVSLTLGEVIEVQGRGVGALTSHEVLTSVNVLGRDQLERETVNEPLELLRRAPAVYLDSFNQGIVSSELGIRGFSTQGDAAASRLLIDGIPSNLHIGVGDLKSISPLEIDRLEVVKGTNDARYGLNNLAGNVNVFTRRAGNERKVRLLAGSFGTVEPQVLAGFDNEWLAQTYFIAYRRSSGFREHSGLDRFSASGKWFLKPNERLRVGLILRGMGMEAQAPGYLSEDAAHVSPTLAEPYTHADGGTQRNAHASLHVDHDITGDLSWSFKAYGQGFLRHRWVRYSPESSQQERIEDEKQYGAISVLTLRTDRFGLRDLSLEWGVDYQLQDNLHQRYATTERERGSAPVRDQAFLFHTFGSYLQAQARPLEALKVVAGLRVDWLAGRFTDRLGAREFDINDYGTILQPKLSAVYTLTPGHNVYANYGRTFQTGVGIGAYKTQDEPLAPSLNDGWEAGYKTSLGSWLTGRVSYWQQYASNEVRLKFDDSGDSENVGRTRRQGFDIELNLQPLEQLMVWGSFSRHVSEQLEPGPAFPERKGRELNHVPDFSTKAGVDYHPLPTLHSSLWMYGQGDYHLTKENDQGQHGGYIVFNFDVSYELVSWAQVGLQVKNLLDTRYATSIWYRDFGGNAILHSPAEGRSFFVSTTATF